MEHFEKAIIMGKYKINYFKCKNCDFVSTEEPYWLTEAYSESINISDAGVLQRNFKLAKISTVIICLFFNKNGKFLDYGGGYGLFVRLMRDIGLDFCWSDPHIENLFARGFEYNSSYKIELITCIEVFEHFVEPLKEIENMLKLSKNILFTTEILPTHPPAPWEWWYYGLEHGQHVSFYSLKTLNFIVRKYGLNFYSNSTNLHLFTEKTLNPFKFRIVTKFSKYLYPFLKRRLKSKTFSDMEEIKKKQRE
jgi:hypothetical protein